MPEENEPIEDPNKESGSNDADEKLTKDEVSKLVEQAVKDAVEVANREAARVQSGLQKQLNELTQAKKQAEDAGKSELEKLRERMDASDAEKSKLRIEALRERLAHQAGLDPEDVDLLTGTDEETVQKQIERIQAKTKKASEEALKKFARDNGRHIDGPDKGSVNSWDQLLSLTDEQIKALPPELVYKITMGG